jgi:hypothetical protein
VVVSTVFELGRLVVVFSVVVLTFSTGVVFCDLTLKLQLERTMDPANASNRSSVFFMA